VDFLVFMARFDVRYTKVMKDVSVMGFSSTILPDIFILNYMVKAVRYTVPVCIV